jgi:hypothetical protein
MKSIFIIFRCDFDLLLAFFSAASAQLAVARLRKKDCGGEMGFGVIEGAGCVREHVRSSCWTVVIGEGRRTRG